MAQYNVLFGQIVEANCNPDKGFGYHVVAHCSDGHALWYTTGSVVLYGFGPATAKCAGELLHRAWLTGYEVVRD